MQRATNNFQAGRTYEVVPIVISGKESYTGRQVVGPEGVERERQRLMKQKIVRDVVVYPV